MCPGHRTIQNISNMYIGNNSNDKSTTQDNIYIM